MKNKSLGKILKFLLIIIALGLSTNAVAQQQNPTSNSSFWKNVRFGGGLGLSIGSGYTNISLAPSAIYDFNKYFSAGVALQGNLTSSKNFYNSLNYGGSLITLFNPIEEVQLSVELEQLRVNNVYKYVGANYKDNFWNTGLFLGGGYRTGNVTIGARYNVLFNKNKNVYNEAFMPFVRVYF